MKLPLMPLLIYDLVFYMKNSGAFSVSGSDHFLRGGFFHENFKIISKKIKEFSWKNFRKIKIPRVFSKNFQEFSWKDVERRI